MWMPGDRYSTSRSLAMKELPMATFLALHEPSFRVQPFQDLPNFHDLTLPPECSRVNMQNDTDHRARANGSEFGTTTQSRESVNPIVRYSGFACYLGNKTPRRILRSIRMINATTKTLTGLLHRPGPAAFRKKSPWAKMLSKGAVVAYEVNGVPQWPQK